MSADAELAKNLKKYFDKIVGNKGIYRNRESARESFNKNPVLTSIEKYSSHPSVKNIKSKMNGTNLNFSFKFVKQDQVFKEIKKLDRNKASKKMIFQSK